jgi:hypothetical protein
MDATDTLVSTVHEPSFELPKVTVSAACGVVLPQEVQLPEELQLAMELAFQVQLLASAARVDAMLARTPMSRVTQGRAHVRQGQRTDFTREGGATATIPSPASDALPSEESTPNRPSRSRCARPAVGPLPGSGGLVATRALWAHGAVRLPSTAGAHL